MDINFQPTIGAPFTIEIGYFDNVLEIKEKIQKYQGIPISKQVLSFKGKVLLDELNVHQSDILDNSILQLIVEDNIKKTAENVTTSRMLGDSIQVPKKKTIPVKGLSSEQTIMFEIESEDRALHLKRKIHELFRIPISQFALQTNGNLLNDNDELTNNLETEVILAIPKKMTIHFTPPTAEKEMMIEMEPSRSVSYLKKRILSVMPGTPIERLSLQVNNNDLDDNILLSNYETLSNNLRIIVNVLP